jgi:hypothetical protein
VVLDTWKIDKANINKLYILFLDVSKNFCRILKHFSPDLGLALLDGRFAEPTNMVLDGENIGGSSKKGLTELLHLCFFFPLIAPYNQKWAQLRGAISLSEWNTSGLVGDS